MPIDIDLRLPVQRQEVQPVPQRRQLAARRPRLRRMVKRGCQRQCGRGLRAVVQRLAAPDPGVEVDVRGCHARRCRPSMPAGSPGFDRDMCAPEVVGGCERRVPGAVGRDVLQHRAPVLQRGKRRTTALRQATLFAERALPAGARRTRFLQCPVTQPALGGPTMIVERIWTGNDYRNFNYLIACPETGEALAIDPLDHEKCLRAGEGRGLEDHADPEYARASRPHRRQRGGGRRRPARRSSRTGDAKDKIADMSRGLERRRRHQGRQDASSSKCWIRRATRCATSACCSHTDQPALFCGDTLFNAGAGNCHNGGHPARALQDVRRAAREAAGQHADLSGPRLHREQPALHARPRAGQRRGAGDARTVGRARTRPTRTSRRSPSSARSTRSSG